MSKTKLERTNLFFNHYVYEPLKHLAWSPNAWAYETRPNMYSIPDLNNLLLWTILAIPVFLPLTLITTGLALSLAFFPALIHGLSALTAATIDSCERLREPPKPKS
jgi:hypothetical protein